LYRWALDSLLAETSNITSFEDIRAYKKGEAYEKFCVFRREHDVYVKVLPCKEGEPVCVDDRADPEEPFFFMYATIFKRLKLRFLILPVDLSARVLPRQRFLLLDRLCTTLASAPHASNP